MAGRLFTFSCFMQTSAHAAQRASIKVYIACALISRGNIFDDRLQSVKSEQILPHENYPLYGIISRPNNTVTASLVHAFQWSTMKI